MKKVSTPKIGTAESHENQRNDVIFFEMVVMDIPSKYYGQNKALIPPNVAKDLSLDDKSFVEIVGNESTFASCKIMSLSEEFLDVATNLPPLLIDSNIRKNAGVVLGDHVKISLVKPIDAERLVLAIEDDSETNVETLNEERLRRYLHNHIVHKQDEIWIPASNVNSVLDGRKTKTYVETLSLHSDLYLINFHITPVLSSKTAYRITDKTEIIIRKNPILKINNIPNYPILLSHIGGLDKQKEDLKQFIGFKVYQPETLKKSNLSFAHAILLTGPSGIGKTMLSKAITNEFPVCLYYINGPEIIGDKPQSTPQELAKIFEDAKKSAPSIILIDEVEALAYNRDDLKFDAISRNIVTAFLHLLDELAEVPDVVLIGTTNKPKTIDSAFRTTNRFSKEISLSPPILGDRKKIIELIIDKSPFFTLNNIDSQKVAEETNGFTGADLNLLFQEVFVDCLKDIGLYQSFINRPLDYFEISPLIAVKTQNFLNVIKSKKILPSLLRSYMIETPKVNFSDVGGLKQTKEVLEENIKFPLMFPDLYKKFGGKQTHGVLLYGPPGCGKTLIAKALASETSMNFIYIKGAEVLNRWLGESEAAIREIFAKARGAAPCIIFLDELDAVATVRGVEGNVHSDRVTAQILTELDGLDELKDVICIGATNRLDIIDPAIMRPGRMYPTLKVDLPDEKARIEILKIHTRKIPLSKDVDYLELARMTDKMGGANIEEICNHAALYAIRENIDPYSNTLKNDGPQEVSRYHFIKALSDLKSKQKSLSENVADLYK